MGDKPFLTLENQILLLESRGLIVPDRDKAKKILLTTNYYYLVNGYSQFLFDFSKNKYFIGATFDELLTIYGYDKDIKATLYASLMRAESFLASIISHVFCELHGGGYSYLNTTNFSSDKNHTLEIARLISTCATVINRNKKLNQIQHYQKNHGDVPLWVAISHFEFGLLSRFFELMNEKARAKITRIINEHLASEFDLTIRLKPKQIETYINNLRMIRNICAHDNRILSLEIASLQSQHDLMNFNGQL
ncbi:MAG: Abi family protein, partial [Culicoidibacterales bacterium]